MRKISIEESYKNLLFRKPDPKILLNWEQSPLSLDEIIQKIKSSEEFILKAKFNEIQFSTSKKNILLFGAYGNGNLGDMIQAISLRRAILSCTKDVNVWATTVMPGNYPYDDRHKLPTGYVNFPKSLACFDLLLVGGGGLLAHPHDPLGDDNWVEQVRIPTAIFGVGASDFFAPKAGKIIRHADHVSGRDFESISSLRRLRPDVDFVPDPVLGDWTFSPHACSTARGDACCWILRGPLSSEHEKILPYIKSRDVIVGFEPKIDGDLVKIFPNIQFVQTVEEFNAALQPCSHVISMRYHGIILALKLGLPAYGLDIPKAGALLDMLGLSNCAAKHINDLLPLPPQDTQRTNASLRWIENYYKIQLKSMLQRLVKPIDFVD